MSSIPFSIRSATNRDDSALLALAETHPRRGLAPQTALRLIRTITANAADILEIRQGERLVGAASVVLANTNLQPRAELDLFAWNPSIGPTSEALIVQLTTHAEARAQALGGASLDVGAEGLLANAVPTLAARGYAVAYTMASMQRARLTEIPLPAPPARDDLVWRKLPADEAPAYRALCVAAFAGIDGVVIPPLADFVISTRTNPPWVLVHDAQLIAFLRLALFAEDGKRIGEVSTVGRDPAWKGQQLGDVLMHKAMAELTNMGADVFRLEAAAKNANALRLYERFGFRMAHAAQYWRRAV